eukprot:CAMPEP_0113936008 /NCGR_PEP_ID=MMETSP1339-20121228/3011_1 /TAXON_ID=94617 /ORGANISM="Fibrocapsa japonica" /LENGTH=221 /DNA_ID=CAMNT_0000938325 /DNA_START=191 /DNA_END=856 /DNA_ORIENTATION=- /assembly_acc=CAM_ASM_000762
MQKGGQTRRLLLEKVTSEISAAEDGSSPKVPISNVEDLLDSASQQGNEEDRWSQVEQKFLDLKASLLKQAEEMQKGEEEVTPVEDKAALFERLMKGGAADAEDYSLTQEQAKAEQTRKAEEAWAAKLERRRKAAEQAEALASGGGDGEDLRPCEVTFAKLQEDLANQLAGNTAPLGGSSQVDGGKSWWESPDLPQWVGDVWGKGLTPREAMAQGLQEAEQH